jgi:sugar phosphate isomerase/epimerase
MAPPVPLRPPSCGSWCGWAAIEALGEHIYHVDGKDVWIEPRSRIAGLLDPKPVTPFEVWSWNYVTLGHGESVRSWLHLLATLRCVGYGGIVSIGNEDHLIEAEEAARGSAEVLKFGVRHLDGKT